MIGKFRQDKLGGEHLTGVFHRERLGRFMPSVLRITEGDVKRGIGEYHSHSLGKP